MILQKVLDDGVPVPKTEDKSVLPSALNRQESDDPSSHSDTELKVIEGEHEPLQMLTVATMETKDTTRLEKAMIKLSITNNDSLENINNSVKKFNALEMSFHSCGSSNHLILYSDCLPRWI
jgi:hypothetical protein